MRVANSDMANQDLLGIIGITFFHWASLWNAHTRIKEALLEKMMSSKIPSSPENSGNFYSFGTRRIGRYLAKRDLPVPDAQALHKALLNHFDWIDHLAAEQLLGQADHSDWHMIVAGEVHSDLSAYTAQAARTFIDALRSVLEVCDRERIFPTGFDRLPDGVRLRVRDKTVAEIRRIHFEPYQPNHCQRVQNALKGIPARGERERMVARLRSLPGFSSIEFRLGRERYERQDRFMLVPFPANWATAMMWAMASLGAPVKRHIAQELVAQLFDASNWQHLVANDGKARVGSMPYAVAVNAADATTWRYYRTAGEAVWAFGNMLSSWGGAPLVIDSCGRARISAGLTLATSFADGPNSGDPEHLPVCTSLNLIEQASPEDYQRLAEHVSAALATGDDPMRILDWSDNFGQNMLASNARRGSADGRTLQLGDWWLRVFDAHHRAYLSIEHFDTDGTRTKEFHIPLYKSTLRHDPENNVLSVTGDYDMEDVATIPNVSAERVEQLRQMIEEPAGNPSALASWGRGDIRGEWPPLPC